MQIVSENSSLVNQCTQAKYNVMFIAPVLKLIREFSVSLSDKILRFLTKESNHVMKLFSPVKLKLSDLEQVPNIHIWAKKTLGIPLSFDLCHSAAQLGNIQVMQELHQEYAGPDKRWDWRIVASAAKGGSVEMVKYLMSLDPPCPLSSAATTCAAWGGHLELIIWLRQQTPPCEFDVYTCAQAAANGHLHVLQWLREQTPPCPWDSLCFSLAAGNGHVNVLQWLLMNKCFWKHTACESAATNGKLEALKWLRAQNPPCPWNRNLCLMYAERNNHMHVVRWISQNIG